MRRPTVSYWVPGLWVLALLLSLTAAMNTQAASSPAGGSGDAVKAGVQDLPDHLTRDQVRELLSKLSDDQARALLIRELDKKVVNESAAAQAQEMNAVDQVHDMVAEIFAALAEYLPQFQ